MKHPLWPCACGRFIHCISISFRRFVHSVSLHSLHYPSLHSASVHFTHLSTAQQKWLIHSATLTHAVPFRKPCLLLNTQGSGVNKSYHCRQRTKAQSCSIPPRYTRCATFNRHLCFHPQHIEHWYALFFLRHIAPTNPHTNIRVRLLTSFL